MSSVSESAPPLPTPYLNKISSGISLLQPLSRRGSGPGVILLVREVAKSSENTTAIVDGVPSPAMKWAEEGYTVAEIRSVAFDGNKDPVENAINALENCDVCEPKDRFGLVAYDPSLWNKASSSLQSLSRVVGAVVYSDANTLPSLITSSIPSVQHLAGKISDDLKTQSSKQLIQYYYPNSDSFAFATPPSIPNDSKKVVSGYHYANEAVSHTRNLSFLKKLMDGPWFDLEAIWDEHTYFEFEARDTQATMATMVQEPYVNHIPTITGGIGREPLSDFYQNHFIFSNPAGTELELISRTVGIDRVVDEFVFKFKHDRVIDWLLPGVPPTNRRAEIPFTAIVNIRGDRLYHEHIAWDQATALRQLGLLPEYLPWPTELPLPLPREYGLDGDAEGNKRYEYRVPAAGAETAEKMRDKNLVQSNGMFEFGIREVRT